VHLTRGDVCGLIFGQDQHLDAIGDPSSAAYHNPMLGANVLFLQAQASTVLHLNVLALEAAAFVDAVAPTPMAVHFAVQGPFFALLHD